MPVTICWTAVGFPELIRDVPMLKQSVVFVGHIYCYGSYSAHRFVAVVEIVRNQAAVDVVFGLAQFATYVPVELNRQHFRIEAPVAVPLPSVVCFLSTDPCHVLSLELPKEV